MSFFRDVVARTSVVIWGGLAASTGVLTYFFGVNDSTPLAQRIILAVCATSAILIVFLGWTAYQLYSVGSQTVKVKRVLEGQFANAGNVVVVLNKQSWISPGLLLTLVTESDGLHNAFAIVQVEAFTTDMYPQCTLVKHFLPNSQSPTDYMLDRSRWAGMLAIPRIQLQHLA